MKNKLIYISHSNGKPQEGGMARNHAFYLEMEKRGAKIYNYTTLNSIGRVFIILRNALLLGSVRNRTFLILQNALLLYVFPLSFMKYELLRKLIQYYFKRLGKRNKLFIEVNDLIYEQSLDLELQVDVNSLRYEQMIFSMKEINFIFASQSMGEFACEQYGLVPNKMQIILNGSPKLAKQSNNDLNAVNPVISEKIRCIYAGTLDRGRQIEELLDVFRNNLSAELILIGINGTWIHELKIKNIKYLGKFDESEALKIAAQCDIGLIPYDDGKLYYNICYPTKVSFYISAGLPILCTPLKETMRALENYKGAVFFRSINDWNEFLDSTPKDSISENKKYVNDIKENFYWENLLNRLSLT